MAVTDGVLPHQGIYQQRKSEAEAAYQRALAALSEQRSGILQDYGFKGIFDDQGKLTDYQVDPTNEYGGVQMLQRQQASGLDSAEEESRLRGFDSRSGFGAQGVEDTRYAQGYEDYQLGRDFLGSVTGLASQQRDILGERNAAFTGIEQDQLYEALQNRLFNQAETPEAGEKGEKSLKDMTSVKVKGKSYTREGLLDFLRQRKRPINPASFFYRNPGRAKKLGFKVPKREPARTINQREIRQLKRWRGNKRKAGWSDRKIRSSRNWVELRKRQKKEKRFTKGKRRKRRRGPMIGPHNPGFVRRRRNRRRRR